MKKNLIVLALVFGVVFSSNVQAQFGTVSGSLRSAGNVVRYSLLTGKNVLKATGCVAQAAASTLVMPVCYTYKSFKNYPKLSSAATGAVLVGLAALWYSYSFQDFMAHPYVVALTNGAIKITGDTVEEIASFLEKCPEYAQWLKQFACDHAGTNCPTPTPTPTPKPGFFSFF